MDRVFYSGGLTRKHKGYGRLDVAGTSIQGNALKMASNDVNFRQVFLHGNLLTKSSFLIAPLSGEISRLHWNNA